MDHEQLCVSYPMSPASCLNSFLFSQVVSCCAWNDCASMIVQFQLFVHVSGVCVRVCLVLRCCTFHYVIVGVETGGVPLFVVHNFKSAKCN